MIEDYGDNPNSSPSEPFRVFFGRLISHGQRHLIRHYSVKNRLFIGNTSMDAQLSLIMANQAKVSEVLRDCLESEQIDAVKNITQQLEVLLASSSQRPLPSNIENVGVAWG